MESVYLLIEREFLQSNCPIYKIGRSSQENDKRIKQYPKGSRLICLINVEDSKFMEKEIFSLFKHKYVQRRDIGSEYFEGNGVMMRKDIFDMAMEYDCVGVLECKKRQLGLKKLVLKELTNKTVVKPEISPIEIHGVVPINILTPVPRENISLYTCESCKYSTKHLWVYRNHIKSKKHIAMQTVATADMFRHVCKHCSKKYKTNRGIRMHKIVCKPENTELETRLEREQAEMIARLERENNDLNIRLTKEKEHNELLINRILEEVNKLKSQMALHLMKTTHEKR
jgi:hypothetical protein